MPTFGGGIVMTDLKMQNLPFYSRGKILGDDAEGILGFLRTEKVCGLGFVLQVREHFAPRILYLQWRCKGGGTLSLS